MPPESAASTAGLRILEDVEFRYENDLKARFISNMSGHKFL